MGRRNPSEVFWTLSLLAFLLASSGTEGAAWLRVSEGKGTSVMYIDPGSVKKIDADTVSARTREVPLEPVKIGDETLIEITSYTEFRCAKNQFRTAETTYSYKSGKTERITAEGMRTWKAVSKASTKDVHDYLCKRP